MEKIPTLFERNWRQEPPILKEVRGGCGWVLDPAVEVVATEKWDGTCCRITEDNFWRRRTLSPSDNRPTLWEPAQPEPTPNGDWPGWVPVEMGDPSDQHHVEGLRNYMDRQGRPEPGTYELVGPMIQDNPHRLDHHTLWPHGNVEVEVDEYSFEGIKRAVQHCSSEGLVFYEVHGERKAKLKRSDFGFEWPTG